MAAATEISLMKTLLAAIAASLAFAAAAEAQTTGPCASGYRWSAGDGTARFETCDGSGTLLTLTCEGPDAIRGTLATGESSGTGRLTVGDQSTSLSLRAQDEAQTAFDLPRDFLDALARGSTATLSTPGSTSDIHLQGSAAAISTMLDTCQDPEPEAAQDPEPEAARDPEPEQATQSETNQPPEGEPLASGTAPAAATIEAFRAARAPEAPRAPASDAPAPARCDALAGGPVAGFGTDDPVPFAALAEASDALAACETALEAEPDTPRHAFHAARIRLARGDGDAAMALIRRAARAGYPPAANALALAILSGRTAPEPGEDTAELFSLAAEAGYPPALANLAIGGTNAGPLADHDTALGFARRAAALGDPVAATLMGTMAFYGTGMPDDAELAARWYRIGAARGDPDALVALADALGSGEGPEAYRDAAIAAGHRTTILGHGLYAPGAVSEADMIAAIEAGPLRHAWEDGLLYLGDGRDSDGALFWTLMWPRRAEGGWGGGAVDLAPLLAALARRYDCDGGRLFKITESRLGCER